MPIIINSGWFGAFTPLNLSPAVWYDPSVSASVTTATGVSQINDLSGNSRHATQGTGANQPAYTTAGLNGLNCMTFDGSNDFLTSTTFTLAQPYTLFVVAKRASDTGGAEKRIVAPSPAAGGPYIFQTNPAKAWAIFAGASVTAGTVDNNAHAICGVFNGASSTLYLDGSSIGTGNVSTGGFSSTGFRLGLDTDGASSPWIGIIAEVVLFGSVISGANLTSMSNYLRTKWGTP